MSIDKDPKWEVVSIGVHKMTFWAVLIVLIMGIAYHQYKYDIMFLAGVVMGGMLINKQSYLE